MFTNVYFLNPSLEQRVIQEKYEQLKIMIKKYHMSYLVNFKSQENERNSLIFKFSRTKLRE